MNPVHSALSNRYSMGVCLLAGLLAVAGVSSTQAATVLVDDQFIDGGLDNGADSLDATWTGLTNSTLSVVQFNSTGNTSNALFINSSPNNAVTKGAFTNLTALAIGEQITLSLDFRMTAAAANDNAGLRFGLGTSSNTYAFTFGTGTPTGAGTAQFAANTVSGTNVPYTSTGTAFAINDTASHTFSFTITRTGANSLSFLSMVDANSVSAVSTNSVSNFTFNSIILGQGSNSANDINIDNVNVTLGAIPEPSTYAALAGLAALGLVAFKRTRTTH